MICWILRFFEKYWRSTSQFEVDLVLGTDVAVEIKGTSLVQDKHMKGLRALKEEGIHKRFIIVSLDRHVRKTADGIDTTPWETFLGKLWNKDLI
ncbi:MAG: hypothetical protein HQM09_22280 [Candidatus Riflebacteria bacterium]|nr:hypothetical protein [Candidatus Riflebacteria bacterium]